MRGLPYDVKALVEKARESALLAVETYNRPAANFRSSAYIVLMVIAIVLTLYIKRHNNPHHDHTHINIYKYICGAPV